MGLVAPQLEQVQHVGLVRRHRAHGAEQCAVVGHVQQHQLADSAGLVGFGRGVVVPRSAARAVPVLLATGRGAQEPLVLATRDEVAACPADVPQHPQY